MLVAFGAVSVWVLGLDLWQVFVHGRHWTGTDGLFLTDQMQYLAWISDASHHLLVSDLFVLRSTPADYFQPLVVISGAIAALGVAPWVAFILWQPVAVLAAFGAVRAYVRRSLAGRWERRAALALALFFGSWGVLGDLWLPFLSWGYPFALIAVVAMLGALLLYDRARADLRVAWGPPLLGALTSSLHPWQGEEVILIVIGAEVLLRAGGSEPATRRLALPAATVIGTALPLAYLAILGRLDPAWRLARDASHHTYSLTSIALALAPLLVVAAFAYRGRPRSFLALATRAWPLAAVAVYVLSESSLSATPLHAFTGITIPLAVLGVEGVQRAGWGRVPARFALAVLAVAAATIPASEYELRVATYYAAPATGNASFVSRSMVRALDYLKGDPEPGGVLTRAYLGVIVPGATGRHTYVGGCQWSQPRCPRRVIGARALLGDAMRPRAARAFVLGTTARFVLSGCNWGRNLATALAPITVSVHRFGCARVYQITVESAGADSIGSSIEGSSRGGGSDAELPGRGGPR